MDLNNEIEEMIQEITPAKASDEREAFGEEPKEEPKEAPKEEPKEEPKPEESPVEKNLQQEQSKGEPVKEEPSQEEVVEPKEDPRILAMQETINQLSQRLLQTQPEAQPSQAPPVAAKPEPPQPQVEMDLSKFQILPEGVEFEDVVNDKSVFERFMRDLLNRYEVSRVRRDTLAAPQLVSRQVQYFLGLNEAVRTFYETNKDLATVKPLVGAFTNRLVAEHPDWSLPQVMEEAAKATRQALGTGRVAVQQQQATSQPQKQVNPSFAKQSSARQSKPAQPSKLEKEIADLIID